MAENQDFVDTPYDYSADEMDVEVDSDQEQDLDKMLHSWLGELESVTQSLDSDLIQVKPDVPQAPAPPKNNLDLFQLSYSNLEETQDIDLDALLGDLCEMEQSLQMDMDIQANQGSTNIETITTNAPQSNITDTNLLMSSIDFTTPSIDFTESDLNTDMPPPPPPQSAVGDFDVPPMDDLPPPPPDMLPPPGKVVTSLEASLEDLTASIPQFPIEITTEPASPGHFEVPSPPIDVKKPTKMNGTVPPSSLNLNLGVGNSQQSMSSLSTSPNFSPPPANISKSIRVKLKDLELDLHNDETLSEEEKVARIKAEKVRIALEKLKAARVKKLIIKVHTEDGSSKTVFVDETMNTRNIVKMMIDKNHFEGGPNWALVEQMPDLHMERLLEDDENVVTDVLLNWSRDTNNRIMFSERREKYALFKNPQHYLLSLNTSQFATEFAEKSKKTLVDEFFVGSGTRVPELEGPLLLKSEGKKSWKKHYFVLRASGLYYSPKGKSKVSKDLVCLVQFEHVEVYSGIGWKKKYKAPTDFCFALKHPQIQQKSKYIKYICAEDYRTCQRWMTGIRIAKYGKDLLKNFEESQRDMYKFIKNQDTASETSLGDTSSLSSDQSVATVSSQGSASSGGSGIQSRVNRRSQMGDIFSQAWKKGKEVEETKRLSRNSMNMSTEEEDKGHSRPPLLTPKVVKSADETFDFDVQQQLMQLERDMELDLNLQDIQPPTNVSASSQNVAKSNTPADSINQPLHGQNKSAPAPPRRMDSTRLSTYSKRSSSFSESRSSSETKRVQFKESTEEITSPHTARAAHRKSASGVELPNSPNLTANSQRSSMKISRSSTNQSFTSPHHRRPSLPLANTVYTPPWLQTSVAAETSTNTSSHAFHSENVFKQIPVPVPKPTVSTSLPPNKANQENIHASGISNYSGPTTASSSVSVPPFQPPKQSTPPLPPKVTFPKKVVSMQPPPELYMSQTSTSPKPPSPQNKPSSPQNKPPSPQKKPPSPQNKPPLPQNKPPSPQNIPPFPQNKPPPSPPPAPPNPSLSLPDPQPNPPSMTNLPSARSASPMYDFPPPPPSLLQSLSQENLLIPTPSLLPPPPEPESDDITFQNSRLPTMISCTSPTSKQPPLVSPKPSKGTNYQLHNGVLPNNPNALPVSPKPSKTISAVSTPPTQPKPSQTKKQGPPSPPKPCPTPSPPPFPSKATPPGTSPKPLKGGSLRITHAPFLEQLNNSLQGTDNKDPHQPTQDKPAVVIRKSKPLPPRRSESTRLSAAGTPKILPSHPQRLK